MVAVRVRHSFCIHHRALTWCKTQHTSNEGFGVQGRQADTDLSDGAPGRAVSADVFVEIYKRSQDRSHAAMRQCPRKSWMSAESDMEGGEIS